MAEKMVEWMVGLMAEMKVEKRVVSLAASMVVK